MIYQTLYGKDSKGKIRIWQIEIEKDKYRTISGLLDGKRITSNWTTVQETNVGRSNHRDTIEQAKFEVDACIKKQIEQENYRESLSELKNSDTIFECMLAQDYNDRKNEIRFPIYCQPKLDGCLSYDTLVSTDIGEIPIGDIVEKNINCLIKTYNLKFKKSEYKKIINRMKNGIDEKEKNVQWYQIKLENDTILKVTGNHLIYLPKLNCWRRVDDLEEGDTILNNC